MKFDFLRFYRKKLKEKQLKNVHYFTCDNDSLFDNQGQLNES